MSNKQMFMVSMTVDDDWSCKVTYALVDMPGQKPVDKKKTEYPTIEAAIHDVADRTGLKLTIGIPCVFTLMDDTSSNAVNMYQYLSDNPELSIYPHICDYTCGEYFLVEFIRLNKHAKDFMFSSESLELVIFPFSTYEQAERFADGVRNGYR